MGIDFLAFNRWDIRRSDTNSLLRMYDLVTGLRNKSRTQQERARNDKPIQCIAKEPQKRKGAL
jgi:hypothetical protein